MLLSKFRLIKQIEGMPSIRNRIELGPELLNQEVQVKQHKGRHLLQVQLKGEPNKLNIEMERIPHLSKETKDRWIEQAAKGISGPSMDRGMDLMK
jgi:hypothetical protein